MLHGWNTASICSTVASWPLLKAKLSHYIWNQSSESKPYFANNSIGIIIFERVPSWNRFLMPNHTYDGKPTRSQVSFNKLELRESSFSSRNCNRKICRNSQCNPHIGIIPVSFFSCRKVRSSMAVMFFDGKVGKFCISTQISLSIMSGCPVMGQSSAQGLTLL